MPVLRSDKTGVCVLRVAHDHREAMETNTKKSLVIFAIAGRPLEGSGISKAYPNSLLHTVRGF